MRTLIQSAIVIDPSSAHHNQAVDMLIEGGIIQAVAAAGTACDVCFCRAGSGGSRGVGWGSGFGCAGDAGRVVRTGHGGEGRLTIATTA